MRALSTLAVLSLVAALPAAPVPKELRVRPDAERMSGLWKVDAGTSHWLFRGDKLYAGTGTTEMNGYTYGFTMKPEASPAEFDLGGASQFAGIYKFVGDELHVAYNSGAVRPTDFTPGGNKILHVLKRPDPGKQ